MANKPTFVLHGRIVTMQSENNVIDNGYLAISDGDIKFITNDINALPAQFKNAKLIETNGTIYPGLIDLHNHFGYNIFPLWTVPKRFDNRGEWRKLKEYELNIKNPAALLANYSISAKAIMRYVESKAIIGGCTTGQGISLRVKDVKKPFEGSMRNVEIPNDNRLLRGITQVNDMQDKDIEDFRRYINDPTAGSFIYHLSEGIDDTSQIHFENLKNNDLINSRLVGIHCLGLKEENFNYLAQKGAKVIWSPFSNQLLYGRTLNLNHLRNSNVLYCLGCDWTPSGSKNLLQELKIAQFVNQQQGNIFSPFELVKMVTSSPAKAIGWEKYLGTLEVGKIADLLILNTTEDDPFQPLISATEKHIDLVIIDGIARYGTTSLMKQLHFDLNNQFEKILIDNREMGMYLFSEESDINNIGYSSSVKTLETILSDLPAFIKSMGNHEKLAYELVGIANQDFQIILDNEIEFDFENNAFKHGVVEINTDPKDNPMVPKIDFDTPTVEGVSYWNRVNSQPNISQELKDYIKSFYTP